MNIKKMWLLILLIAFLGATNSLTAENPKRLSDICLGICGGSPNAFVEFNGKLFFSANDGVFGFELWAFDGVNPPAMVADINPGASGSNPRSFKVFQDKLFFSAQDVAHSVELWVYDGSNPPALVADIWAGGYPSNPSYLTVFNNRLYFSAGDGRAHGYELFAYDGVNAPSLVADINQHLDPSGNSEASNPTGLTVFNGKLCFQATDGDYGKELWEYDGVFFPRMVADIDTNPGMGSNPAFFTEYNGELYFSAIENDGSTELWKYNGFTQPSRISFPQENPCPSYLTVFSDRLYFYANDNVIGRELWSFDGVETPAAVTDINPGLNGSISLYSPSNMMVYSGRLFFQATDGASGFELWSYDGTVVPQMVSDIFPGTDSANPDYFYIFNNSLFFKADDGLYGKELWAYEQVSMTVTAPNGDESWTAGESYDITWSSTGLIAGVNIDYSTDNGSSWVSVISDTENDGSYVWTIPSTISSQGLIKISAVGNTASDVSDTVFSIIVNPTITVTTPNGGENWEAGTAQNITWSCTGAIANVKLEYSVDSGSSWNTISASTANNGSYNWVVVNSPSSTCFIKVSDTASTVADTNNSTFTISPQRTITVTAPNGGESWRIGTYQYISWNWTGVISNIKIEYSTNGGASWGIIVASIANTGSYRWKVTGPASTNCRVKVSATAGSLTDISNNVFRIRR